MYDLGQAVSMLLMQATSLGLITHQMAGFDPETKRAPRFMFPITMRLAP